jgi:hypothetical protein
MSSATTGFSAETEKTHIHRLTIGFLVKTGRGVIKKGEPYSEIVSFILASSANSPHASGTSGVERRCWMMPKLETAV